jgi:hypothetical protein
MNAFLVSDAETRLTVGVVRRDDKPLARHQGGGAQRLAFGGRHALGPARIVSICAVRARIRADLATHLQPVHPRHFDVHQDKIEAPLTRCDQRSSAVSRLGDPMAVCGKQTA